MSISGSYTFQYQRISVDQLKRVLQQSLVSWGHRNVPTIHSPTIVRIFSISISVMLHVHTYYVHVYYSHRHLKWATVCQLSSWIDNSSNYLNKSTWKTVQWFKKATLLQFLKEHPSNENYFRYRKWFNCILIIFSKKCTEKQQCNSTVILGKLPLTKIVSF